MSLAHPFAAPTRVLRDFSGQVAISIAASAVAAAFIAAPDALSLFGAPRPVATAAAEPVWTSPLPADGKIRTRHRDAETAIAQAFAPGMGATPAALAMPMALEWAPPAAIRVALAEPPARQTPPEPLAAPVRRVAPVERPKPQPVAAPLVIAPAVLQASIEAVAAPRPPAPVGRGLPEPVAQAGGLIWGAAGLVGAAGSWTAEQAKALIPRW